MTEHIGNRLIELTDDECQALLESGRIGPPGLRRALRGLADHCDHEETASALITEGRDLAFACWSMSGRCQRDDCRDGGVPRSVSR